MQRNKVKASSTLEMPFSLFDINNLDNLYDAVECAQREYERYGIPYNKVVR